MLVGLYTHAYACVCACVSENIYQNQLTLLFELVLLYKNITSNLKDH